MSDNIDKKKDNDLGNKIDIKEESNAKESNVKDNNVSNKKSSKTENINDALKLLFFSVCVFLVAILVYILFFSGDRAQKAQIKQYLRDKYNEEFNITYLKKRQALEYESWGCDGSNVSCAKGKDEDVIEYVYSFSPKKNYKIKNYLIYSYNARTKKYDIFETSSPNYQLCGQKKEDYYKYDLMGNDLKEILKKYYPDHRYYNSDSVVKVEISKALIDELENNYENLKKFYEAVSESSIIDELSITIEFSDSYKFYINSHDSLENNRTIMIIRAYLEIKDNLKYDVSIKDDQSSIDILIPKTLEDEVYNNYDNFIEMYTYLLQIYEKYHEKGIGIILTLVYNDNSMQVSPNEKEINRKKINSILNNTDDNTDKNVISLEDITGLDLGNLNSDDIAGLNLEDLDLGDIAGIDLDSLNLDDITGKDLEDLNLGDIAGLDLDSLNIDDTTGLDLKNLQDLVDVLINSGIVNE